MVMQEFRPFRDLLTMQPLARTAKGTCRNGKISACSIRPLSAILCSSNLNSDL